MLVRARSSFPIAKVVFFVWAVERSRFASCAGANDRDGAERWRCDPGTHCAGRADSGDRGEEWKAVLQRAARA